MNRVDGKVCVVTGGTQGLGAAIARRLAEAGAAGVVTCGRGEAMGAAVAEAIARDTGAPVRFLRADLARVEDCSAVIGEADARFGRLDVLVNAAGLTDRGDILSTSPELFDRMIAVNLRAPFFLMQDAIALMLRDGVEGSIVNIGSTSERAGQPFIAPYCVSKGALATLTRNTASRRCATASASTSSTSAGWRPRTRTACSASRWAAATTGSSGRRRASPSGAWSTPPRSRARWPFSPRRIRG
jgi:NAD(P)-dependent dehydrogenase (short-subunit alcohol dehydrogenase family)